LQDLNRSAHGMFLRLQEICYLVPFNISYRVCNTRFLLNIINALRGRRPRLNRMLQDTIFSFIENF